jgi:hypothetical protein
MQSFTSDSAQTCWSLATGATGLCETSEPVPKLVPDTCYWTVRAAAVASVSNAVLGVPFAADTGSPVHNRKPPERLQPLDFSSNPEERWPLDRTLELVPPV